MAQPTAAPPTDTVGSRFRAVLAAAVLVLVLVAATSAVAEVTTTAGTYTTPPSGAHVLRTASDQQTPSSVLVSRALFTTSPEVIAVAADAAPQVWDQVRSVAADKHVPVFRVDDPGRDAVRNEIGRLGAHTAYVAGGSLDLGDGVTTADLTGVQGNPAPHSAQRPLVYLTPSDPPDAAATAIAAGAKVVPVPIPDARATGDSVRELRGTTMDTSVLATDVGFGDDKSFANQIKAATSTPQLPGGGQIVYPMRRMVALYGSPGAPSLGPLGQQDLPASIARVKRMAADYQRVSPVPVIPAFEIIATVASSAPGPDNQYSTAIDAAELRPWVQAAAKAGVYVTLDLQPGRTDFLAQAKRYVDLLRMPTVGLALDPEWRLKPDQVHLTQIGSVGADEVNRTSRWLAGLVGDNHLPQKVFVLHEFNVDMLADRGRIDTSHPELTTVIHADGHGIPSVKMQTWRAITADLPPGVRMGWKNFYTEDTPMFSPKRTMAIQPTPWFISYQ